MNEPVPEPKLQRTLPHKPTLNEVHSLYKLINVSIFNNKLSLPVIEFISDNHTHWGMCYGDAEKVKYRNTRCRIEIVDRYYCRQWLVTILAHEMCHQYQWDIIGAEREQISKNRLMSHGPSFFMFRDNMKAHGITLRRQYHIDKWLDRQIF